MPGDGHFLQSLRVAPGETFVSQNGNPYGQVGVPAGSAFFETVQKLIIAHTH